MAFPLQEQYVNLLTSFGFMRVFGSEANKRLLVDFLNTLLPNHHQIESLSHNLSNRKAIFDIYCQGANGDRFVVELQKAKHNFFGDRSSFYASFPLQEKVGRGEWNFELVPIYSVGILDFVFKDHRNEETIIHTVERKDQNREVFHNTLKFIYIELPKFNKTIDELETRQDKWLYLLRHLPEIEGKPKPFQVPLFLQLLKVTEIANLSREEQDSYQSSLKYYRDMINVIETARQEGYEEGRRKARQDYRAGKAHFQ